MTMYFVAPLVPLEPKLPCLPALPLQHLYIRRYITRCKSLLCFYYYCIPISFGTIKGAFFPFSASIVHASPYHVFCLKESYNNPFASSPQALPFLSCLREFGNPSTTTGWRTNGRLMMIRAIPTHSRNIRFIRDWFDWCLLLNQLYYIIINFVCMYLLSLPHNKINDTS